MKKSEIFFRSFLDAIGVVAYISLIAFLLSGGEKVFQNAPNFIAPLFMLVLFVISATVTAFFVLSRPVQFFISGMRKEAFSALFFTLAWLVIVLIAIVISLMLK
jgi:hypothetical protein